MNRSSQYVYQLPQNDPQLKGAAQIISAVGGALPGIIKSFTGGGGGGQGRRASNWRLLARRKFSNRNRRQTAQTDEMPDWIIPATIAGGLAVVGLAIASN